MKERHKKILCKLLFTLALALVVFLFWILKLNCVWRELLHIPCIGCGMTRAYVALLHGEIGQAFEYHFMFWSVPILLSYVYLDGQPTKNKTLNCTVLIVIGIGFLVRWILWFV